MFPSSMAIETLRLPAYCVFTNLTRYLWALSGGSSVFVLCSILDSCGARADLLSSHDLHYESVSRTTSAITAPSLFEIEAFKGTLLQYPSHSCHSCFISLVAAFTGPLYTVTRDSDRTCTVSNPRIFTFFQVLCTTYTNPDRQFSSSSSLMTSKSFRYAFLIKIRLYAMYGLQSTLCRAIVLITPLTGLHKPVRCKNQLTQLHKFSPREWTPPLPRTS